MFTWTFMLVGLGNANFIISHKFTEKRQNNCETKNVDDRCTHRSLGYCGKNTNGGSKGGTENRAQAKLREHWGPFCQTLSRHRTSMDLREGCY